MVNHTTDILLPTTSRSALRPTSPYAASDADPFNRLHSATSSANNTPLNSPPNSPPFRRRESLTGKDVNFNPLTHAHTAGEAERGRSSHRESATATANDGNPLSPSAANARIRFAPLPLIKPRSYSTGRNVYLSDAPDVAEGTLGDGAERSWVRREADEDFLVDDDQDLANLSDSDEEDSGKGIFGSWGGSSGSAFKSRKDDDSGLSAKLLRPLTFGLGRKKSSRRSPSADSRASGTTLSRTSSMESDAGKIGHDLSRVSSTTSSNGGAPFKSSGVPLRKASTWEPGEKRKSRPVYPSVAQKSRNARRAPVDVTKIRADPAAPAFNEWGTGASVGSVGARPGASAEDGDDGSGMAWIKKRRLQREEEARKKAEEEAQLANDDQQHFANANAITPTATATGSPAISGTSTPIASAPTPSGLTLQKPSLPVLITSPASPSPHADAPEFDFDDLNNGPRSAPPTVDSFAEADKAAAARSQGVRASDDEDDDDDSDSVSDDEEDGEQDDEDDDDLDAEELAAEEALAAAAKESEAIKGTGQERFHSTHHETKMLAINSKDSAGTVKPRNASGRSLH